MQIWCGTEKFIQNEDEILSSFDVYQWTVQSDHSSIGLKWKKKCKEKTCAVICDTNDASAIKVFNTIFYNSIQLIL